MRVVVEKVAIIDVIVTIPHIAITTHLIAGTSPLAVVVAVAVAVVSLYSTLNQAQNITTVDSTTIGASKAKGCLTADGTSAAREMEAEDATGDSAPSEILSDFICTLLVQWFRKNIYRHHSSLAID
jgi:hypothetical protein